jgi:Flp pilus assembly protein TadG
MQTLEHLSNEGQVRGSCCVRDRDDKPARQVRGWARVRRGLMGFLRTRNGVTVVEAAFILPVFLGFCFAFLETTMLYFSAAVMEGQVAEASRQIRTGNIQAEAPADQEAAFRTIYCNITISLMDCNDIVVDVRNFSSFGTITYPSVFDADDEPTGAAFDPGGASTVVVVRTYYRWEVMTPFAGYLLGDHGNPSVRTLNSNAIFRTEPFT